MSEPVTLQYLQQYIHAKDHNPGCEANYFIKLVEEVGELARAMMRPRVPAAEDALKGTLEEELYDVLYYTLALANHYDIDLAAWVPVKEAINHEKYGDSEPFVPGR